MYQAINKLKEEPETANSGNKWTTLEDNQLMEMIRDNIITTTVVDYHKIANKFKRTVGSIKARIKLNIYKMIDEDNAIETLCDKYLIDVSEMSAFVESKKRAEKDKSTRIDSKSKKISIEDIYDLLVSYKDDIGEIKTSIKHIYKKLGMLGAKDNVPTF
jgi:hypothetical protein